MKNNTSRQPNISKSFLESSIILNGWSTISAYKFFSIIFTSWYTHYVCVSWRNKSSQFLISHPHNRHDNHYCWHSLIVTVVINCLHHYRSVHIITSQTELRLSQRQSCLQKLDENSSFTRGAGSSFLQYLQITPLLPMQNLWQAGKG